MPSLQRSRRRARKLFAEALERRDLLAVDLTDRTAWLSDMLAAPPDGESPLIQVDLRRDGLPVTSMVLAEGETHTYSLHFSEPLAEAVEFPFYFESLGPGTPTYDDFAVAAVGPGGISPGEGSGDAPNWVTLPAGEQDFTFTLSALVDAYVDADEQLRFVVDTAHWPAGFELAAQDAGTLSVTFREPWVDLVLETVDPISFNFVPILNHEVLEDETVWLHARLRDTVLDVDLSLVVESAGSAATPEDYTLFGESSPLTLQIPAGTSVSGRIPFRIQDDVDARRELLRWEGRATPESIVAVNSAYVTIQDDEIVPTVQLTLVAPTVIDGAAVLSDNGIAGAVPSGVTLRVELAPPVDRDVVVDVLLSGDATAGSDYEFFTASLVPYATRVDDVVRIVFYAGSSRIDFQLFGADMASVQEPDESIVATLDATSFEYQVGAEHRQSAVIVDVDSAPTIDFEFATGTVSESAAEIFLEATLSKRYLAQSVPLTFVGGTKTPAAEPTRDFVRAFAIDIPAGALHARMPVTLINDQEYEADEWIFASVDTTQPGLGVQVDGNTPAEALLVSDDLDARVTVTMEHSLLREGESTRLTFQVVPPSTEDVYVTLQPGGAAAPDRHGNFAAADYLLEGRIAGTVPSDPGRFVIRIPGSPDGSPQTYEAVLSAQDDPYDEPQTESFTLQIHAVAGASFDPTWTGQAAIEDNDAPPLVSLDYPGAYTDIAEQEVFIGLAVRLSELSELPITVPFDALNSALLHEDYELPDGSVATFPPGESIWTGAIRFVDNQVRRSVDPILELRIRDGDVVNADASGATPVLITLRDNDPIPVVNLVNASDTPRLFEGARPDTAVIQAVLTGALADQEVRLPIVTQGTATVGSGGDATLSTQTLVIPARTATGAVVVTVVDDLFAEPNLETLDLSIDPAAVAGQGLNAGVLTQSLTIQDDEAAPELTLAVSSTTLLESRFVILTAALSVALSEPVNIPLSFAGEAAVQTDFYAPDSITIPARQTSASVRISSVSDRIYERDESFTIAVDRTRSSSVWRGEPIAMTLADDDAPPRVTQFTYEGSSDVAEGTDKSITVRLNGLSKFPTRVSFAYDGSPAPAATPPSPHLSGDFLVLGTAGGLDRRDVVEIAPGETRGVVRLSATVDLIDEPDERVRIRVASVEAVNTTGSDDLVFGPTNDRPNATFSLLDRNEPPIVGLRVDGVNGDRANLAEGLESARLFVELYDEQKRPVVSGKEVSVTLEFAGAGPSPATSGDFRAVREGITVVGDRITISVPAGATRSVPLDLFAVADGIDEEFEKLVVSIDEVRSAQRVEPISGPYTFDLLDRDAEPGVRLAQVRETVAEGETIVIRAELYDRTTGAPVAAGRPVSARVSFAPTAASELPPAVSNATPSQDLSVATFTLTIPAGRDFASTTLRVIDDASSEGPEIAAWEILEATHATPASSARVSTIIQASDLLPYASLEPIADLRETAGGRGGNTTRVTVNLSAPAPAGGVQVAIDFDRRPTLWDFQVLNLVDPSRAGLPGAALLTIREGASRGSFVLKAATDDAYESTQRFDVEIVGVTSAVDYQITSARQTLRLLDDDSPPSLQLSSRAPAVSEGSSTPVTMRLSHPTTLPIVGTIQNGTSDTAERNVDYVVGAFNLAPSAPGRLVLQGETSFDGIADHDVNEGSEQANLRATAVIDGATRTSNRLTVRVANHLAPVWSVEGPRFLRPGPDSDAGPGPWSQEYLIHFDRSLLNWTVHAYAFPQNMLPPEAIVFEGSDSPARTTITSNTARTVRFFVRPQTTGRVALVVELSDPIGARGNRVVRIETSALPNSSPEFSPLLEFSPSFEDDDDALGASIAELIASGEQSTSDFDFEPEAVWRDDDPNAVRGLAFTDVELPPGVAALEYTMDGGATWQAMPALSLKGALLLSADGPLNRIRVKLVENASYSGPPVLGEGLILLRYVAWDRTEGDNGELYDVAGSRRRAGTGFGAVEGKIRLGPVENVNDAPAFVRDNLVFDHYRISSGGVPSYSPARSGGEYFVGGFSTSSSESLLTTVRDVDGSRTDSAYTGIAVFDAWSEAGTWQYRTTAGRPWISFRDLNEGRGVDLHHAVLLDIGSELRFIPFDADWRGQASLQFMLWDGAMLVGTDEDGEPVYRTDRPGDLVAIPAARRGGTSPFSKAAGTIRVARTGA